MPAIWFKREETRAERYDRKVENGLVTRFSNLSIATVHFQCDSNLGMLVRNAACFGCDEVHVIGSLPSHRDLVAKSGNTQNLVTIRQWNREEDFLNYCKMMKVKVISVELGDSAVDCRSFELDPDEKYVFVIGNESYGIPAVILMNSSQVVKIAMPGAGICLNAAVASGVILYEATRNLF